MGKRLIIGLFLFFTFIFIGIPFIYQRFRSAFKESPEFRTVENAVKKNKAILEQTGGVIEFEDFGGDIVGDSARISVTIKGENMSILARYYLSQRDTLWEIKSYEMFIKSEDSDKWIPVPE